MFQNGTNCTKDLHISNKSSTFAYGFHVRIWIYGEIGHPSQRLRGVFCCLIGLKNCPFYEKSTFFEKKSGKNFVVSKKSITFAPSNK